MGVTHLLLLLGLSLWLTVITLAAADAGASGSTSMGSDDGRRADARALEQRLHASSAERQAKKDAALKLLLAHREEVHAAHMARHRLVDPDEHAEVTEDIRRRFRLSRRNLFVEQAPQSLLQTVLLIIIVTFPRLIFIVWLRF